MAVNRKTFLAVLALVVIALIGGGYYYWQHHGHDHAAEKATTGKSEAAKVQYTCPMHPFILKEQPGTCPICAMELVKKVAGAEMSGADKARLGEVALSPAQNLMANVAILAAARKNLVKEINAVGLVTYDQSRQAKVTAWVAGRLDRLLVTTVGEMVAKGKPVAEIYSPELVAAQQEYLLAVKSRDQLKHSVVHSIAQGGEGLVASSRQRLQLLGVTEEQIAGLEKDGKPNIRLSIYTPISGVVIEKLVQQGQYVSVGDPLFNVADLSRVWVELDLFESDLGVVRVGQTVEIMPQSYPGQRFSGRVAFINPFLDAKTRTVKVRVELANPQLQLKPEMFVGAKLRVPLGNSVVVPTSALMDTGKRQVVWVQVKPGHYAPREVKAGERVGEQVQILVGLKAGEIVAVSGGYLIDSEAQLSGGSGTDHSQHTAPLQAPGVPLPAPPPAPDKGHEGHTAPASPAKKPLNMDDMKM
jgi:membrane fusion protein, copper/silver efflux system